MSGAGDRTNHKRESSETREIAYCDHQEVEGAFRDFIVSASGWRAPFSQGAQAPSSGTPGSSNVSPADPTLAEVSPAHEAIVAAAALAFGELLLEEGTSTVVIGTDTRPTGPRIAEVAARVLLSQGFAVRYAGVSATPELLAYVRESADIDGFFLITASHNPIQYNGIKLGLGDGAVLAPERATPVAQRFRDIVHDGDVIRHLQSRANDVDRSLLAQTVQQRPKVKEQVYATYRNAVTRVFTGLLDEGAREEVWRRLVERIQAASPGVLIDYNGGARAESLDGELLRELGVRLTEMNARSGKIAHEIVPEGAGLEPCVKMLRELHGRDPRYNLGYVTDNDGDRANIVVYDAQISAVRSIQAQELFALVCMVELAWLVHTGRVTYDGAGHVRERVALVANGPTSLRVDRIAEAFGVELFRAEVGEANVVSLARALRRQGYVVRVLGEGSNGGSIIEPGEVRDPLATLGALLKLLYTPDLSGSTANDLFHIWCERWGSAELYRQDYTLSEVIDSLPPFRTTGTAEARAKVDIGGADPEALKSAYARLVSTHWEELRSALEPHLEIHRWEIVHHRGTDELHGARKPAFGYTSPGGFKVILKNSTGRHVGFAWMRGSGTEPVFRVIADTEGADERAEQLLLNWHSDLVRKAARSAEEFSGKPETPST